MTWTYVWLGVTVLALVIEFLTSDLISIWFAGGGIVAIALSAFNLTWYIHVSAFLVVSFILLFSFRKIALKRFSANDVHVNADAVIGAEFKLLSPIGFNEPGTIKVNDVVWSAVAKDQNQTIEQGKIVKVIDLKGNKYIVEEVNHWIQLL